MTSADSIFNIFRNRVRATLAVIVLLLSSAVAYGQVQVEKDISYLDEGHSETMDVYTPPQTFLKPFSAVLLIHGGGWISGDKADNRGKSISTDLASVGFKVFAVNYKLAIKDSDSTIRSGAWPENFYDCKSALRFIRKNAALFGIDPNHIAVMGESAGGHLALLVGATAHAERLNHGGLYTEQSNAVACVVDMYGIPDLSDRALNYVRSPFRGTNDQQTDENLRIASPMTYIDKSTPPILILHGTADKTVPIQESQKLVRILKEKGTTYQYIEIPDAPHSFNLHPPQMDLRPAVITFLKKCIGEPKTSPPARP